MIDSEGIDLVPKRYDWTPLLAFFLRMPPPRSLRVTCDSYAKIVGDAAPRIGAWRTTSARDHWQQRAAEYDEERSQRLAAVMIDDAEAAEREHLALAQSMSDLSGDALGLLAKTPGNISADDARKLGREGIVLSRLVSGQATERAEVVGSFANFLHGAVLGLFIRSAHACMAAGRLSWDSAPLAALRWEFSEGLQAITIENLRGLGAGTPEFIAGEGVDPNVTDYMPRHAVIEELSAQPDYQSGSAGAEGAS